MKKRKYEYHYILNLTQHETTEAQKRDGVVEPPPEIKRIIREKLTFDFPPNRATMENRAEALVKIAQDLGYQYVMIGGPPFFMGMLEWILSENNIHPLYAFSKRETIEELQEDRSVIRRNVFRYLGFVDPF